MPLWFPPGGGGGGGDVEGGGSGIAERLAVWTDPNTIGPAACGTDGNQLLSPDGSESLPAYSFAGANNMGIRRSGATMYLVRTGQHRLAIGSSVEAMAAFVPNPDDARLLGSPARRWSDLHVARSAFCGVEVITRDAVYLTTPEFDTQIVAGFERMTSGEFAGLLAYMGDSLANDASITLWPKGAGETIIGGDGGALRPVVDDDINLGRTDRRWVDGFFSGQVYHGDLPTHIPAIKGQLGNPGTGQWDLLAGGAGVESSLSNSLWIVAVDLPNGARFQGATFRILDPNHSAIGKVTCSVVVWDDGSVIHAASAESIESATPQDVIVTLTAPQFITGRRYVTVNVLTDSGSAFDPIAFYMVRPLWDRPHFT